MRARFRPVWAHHLVRGTLLALLALVTASCAQYAPLIAAVDAKAAAELDNVIALTDAAKCRLPISAVERNCKSGDWCKAHLLLCPVPNIAGALAE